MARWTVADSTELYNIANWGLGYFRINERGNVALNPPVATPLEIDLKQLVDDLVARGIELPVLLRFTDLIQARVESLVSAFERAIREYDYKGVYRGVYPIKVNQQRHIVEDLIRFSRPHHLGLEAGSKPELLIVLALLTDPDALIVCNGYKDRDYIETAMLAHKLGRKVIVVVEKLEEVELIIDIARKHKLVPLIGVRAKLSSKGTGRWQGSAGDTAKFGLNIREIAQVVTRLKEVDLLGSLQLLHFHIGSQVSAIRAFKTAMREATRIFTELHRMGAPMKYFDVGGGLGVDYDGSRTNFSSSTNYDVYEYALDIVANIVTACDETGVDHPTIITESGRSMVAYNSVLVMDVLGTTRMAPTVEALPPGPDADELLTQLWEVYNDITAKNLQGPYHDAVELKEEALTRFNLGLVDLETRAGVEGMFWRIVEKLVRVSKGQKYLPEEVGDLEKMLADIYFCNFSLFQSAPDSWAIEQLFPILPIHRLDERPSRQGVLADITCDSDGKIDKFIDLRDVKNALELHEPNGQPYYLGVFLVGAYQEILGDLHNLFGDTNAVHVRAVPGGSGYRIEHVVEGDTVTEVLRYVQYDRDQLLSRLRRSVEDAIAEDRLTPEEGRLLVANYIRGLESYTYLGNDGAPPAEPRAR